MQMFPVLSIFAALATGAPPVRPHGAPPANVRHGCASPFDPAADYFPDRTVVEDAANFSVEYRRSYKVVTVRHAYAAGTSERYVLLQCGAPVPALDGPLAAAQVVTVPIQSLFSFSTTHVQVLGELGRVDVLTGVARLRELTDNELIARAAAGRIRQFAPLSVLETELVVSSRPELVMTSGTGNAGLAVIRDAGIPVVANTEWRETTALGRAEWIKLTALFLNEERTANEKYRAMKARYLELRARARAQPASTRPRVMTGRSNRGTWTIAGGRSYVAALVADAGGQYVWADNPATGTASIDIEAQIVRAASADVWINGGGWKDRAGMLDDEPRYAAFTSFQRGQVWVYEKRMTPSGANDYWSRGLVRPDLVLADLIRIFHPRLLSGHELEWYRQVPAR